MGVYGGATAPFLSAPGAAPTLSTPPLHQLI